jgi:uncharacterized protein YndB with AHSA1/START domain
MLAYHERESATEGLHLDEAIERREVLPAPPERVWEALTEAGELSEWFGAEVSGELRAMGRITFRWGDGRERPAVIEELERPRRLAFRWLPFERHRDGETRVVGTGRVEISVEEVHEGSRITVAERGPIGARLGR